jgi:hypothetical protein
MPPDWLRQHFRWFRRIADVGCRKTRDEKSLIFPGIFTILLVCAIGAKYFPSVACAFLVGDGWEENMRQQFCVRPAADAVFIRVGANNILAITSLVYREGIQNAIL